MNGYAVHQSIELGGHIADHSGNGAMWDTLVNLQSGPRILSNSLTLHSIDQKKTPFFDDLSTNSFGYGGDPYDATFCGCQRGGLISWTAASGATGSISITICWPTR